MPISIGRSAQSLNIPYDVYSNGPNYVQRLNQAIAQCVVQMRHQLDELTPKQFEQCLLKASSEDRAVALKVLGNYTKENRKGRKEPSFLVPQPPTHDQLSNIVRTLLVLIPPPKEEPLPLILQVFLATPTMQGLKRWFSEFKSSDSFFVPGSHMQGALREYLTDTIQKFYFLAADESIQRLLHLKQNTPFTLQERFARNAKLAQLEQENRQSVAFKSRIAGMGSPAPRVEQTYSCEGANARVTSALDPIDEHEYSILTSLENYVTNVFQRIMDLLTAAMNQLWGMFHSAEAEPIQRDSSMPVQVQSITDFDFSDEAEVSELERRLWSVAE